GGRYEAHEVRLRSTLFELDLLQLSDSSIGVLSEVAKMIPPKHGKSKGSTAGFAHFQTMSNHLASCAIYATADRPTAGSTAMPWPGAQIRASSRARRKIADRWVLPSPTRTGSPAPAWRRAAPRDAPRPRCRRFRCPGAPGLDDPPFELRCAGRVVNRPIADRSRPRCPAVRAPAAPRRRSRTALRPTDRQSCSR